MNKKRSAKPAIISFIIVIILFSASIGYLMYEGRKDFTPYVGKYTKGNFYIELKENGEFTVRNYISLDGEYKVNSNVVIFNINSMSGKTMNKTVEGKIDGNTLTGPDKLEYVKEAVK